MAERRLFHVKIPNTADPSYSNYEAFYEAHTVVSVRKDAEESYVTGPTYRGQVVEVKHENLTKNPTEFYKRLKDAESRGKVVPSKIKGLGQRWSVEPQEDINYSSIPFGIAADDNGGVPPSLDTLPDGFDDLDDPASGSSDDYRDDGSHEAEMSYSRRIQTKVGVISFNTHDEEDAADTGKLPNLDEADQTLDELRRDPSTYPLVNEIDTEQPVEATPHLHDGNHDSYLNY